MRKVPPHHFFLSLLLVLIIPGILDFFAMSLIASLPSSYSPGPFMTGVIAFLLFYIFALCSYRIFLSICPLKPGYIPEKSTQELIFNVYIFFFLLLFYPIIRSNILPVPLVRLVYQALGAKLGPNVWPTNTLYDPIFISIGENTIVGNDCALIPHVMEGRFLAHYPIKVGKNVTIGRGSTVLSDVTIGDNAIVAAGAVVSKGTNIGPGEIWGGVPAKLIRTKSPDELAAPQQG